MTIKSDKKKYSFVKDKKGFVEINFGKDSCGLSTLIAEELWNEKGVSFSAQKKEHFLMGGQKVILKSKDNKKALLGAIKSINKKLDFVKKTI